MKIVLFGCPGSGKGTQGKLLSNYLNIPHISVGSIYRENVENETELGIQIKDIIESGNFVPDDITNEMINSFLLEKDDYILDGYPRNFAQADFYKENHNADYYILLDVIRKIAEHRILVRGIKEGRVDDSSKELIDKRFEIYDLDTKNGIYLFKDELYTVNGELEIDVVFEIIKEIINV